MKPCVIWRFRYVYAIAVMLLGGNAFSAELGDVLANPKEYHGQRIDVVGIARVPGDFLLFPNPESASRLEEKAALFVVQKTIGPDNFPLDRQWVRVEGVIDSKGHGRGSSPCELLLKRVAILRDRPPPRIKEDSVFGVFHNSTSTNIHVELSSGRNITYAELWIGPKESSEVAIHEGAILAIEMARKRGVSTWEESSGIEVARGKIEFPKLNPDYVYSAADSDQRTLYYKISRGKIDLVAALEGRRWKASLQK
jgi:hypothetical protein